MRSKSISLTVVFLLSVSVFGFLLPDIPESVQAGTAIVVMDPHIFVPGGEGAELLMDGGENVYWLHVVNGDVHFRKYNSHHVLVVPDKPLFTDGINENVDAVFDAMGNIHLTWATDSFGAQSVMYSKLDKDGNAIVPPTKLSGGNSARDHSSAIGVNSLGQAYVAWDHWWDPSDWAAEDILYAKIDSDGSIIFTQEYVASESWETDFYGRKDIVVDRDDNLHVFFDRVYSSTHDIHLFYKKYGGDGRTVLVGEKKLIPDTYYYWSSSAEAVLDSQNRINLAYSIGVQGGKIEIHYVRMDVQGNIDVSPVVLSDGDAYHSHQAHMVMDDHGNSFVFWRETKDGNSEVYYSVVDGNGKVVVGSSRVTSTREDEVTYFMGAVFDSKDFLIWSYYDEKGTYVVYQKPTEETLEAEVDCFPKTLNLKSRGKWITCFIELPEGYDPREIDASTILLNGVLKPELDSKYGFVRSEGTYIVDHDGDGIEERMVKFDRSAVQEMLSSGESVLLVITGELYDGTKFRGSDVIRVIDPPKPKCSDVIHEPGFRICGVLWDSHMCWQKGLYARI
ncbi:MAG: hypothetical protein KAW09_01970 [Thermoplasmata archaeon]|nr:hypothetical protein [Thermoplasmata archaeon]